MFCKKETHGQTGLQERAGCQESLQESMPGGELEKWGRDRSCLALNDRLGIFNFILRFLEGH